MGWCDRLSTHTLPGLTGVFDIPGQAGDGWLFKQRSQWHFDLENLAYPSNNLGCQERMTSQMKEVVVDSNAGQAKHTGPDLRKCLFKQTTRADKVPLLN